MNIENGQIGSHVDDVIGVTSKITSTFDLTRQGTFIQLSFGGFRLHYSENQAFLEISKGGCVEYVVPLKMCDPAAPEDSLAHISLPVNTKLVVY